MRPITLTARIEREYLSDGQPVYVALCLELDIASQGVTVEQAKENLIEAVELFLETAPASERERRLPDSDQDDVTITRIEVPFRRATGAVGAGSL